MEAAAGVPLFDAIRWCIAVASLLFAALVARIGWHRRAQAQATNGSLGYVVFAGFALVAAVDQLMRLHEPATWRLPTYALLLVLGLVWALSAVRLRLAPPWRR